MIEWMAQADPTREANTVKKMIEKSLFLSLNKITHYFKKWTTPRGVLKKIYCLYLDLMFQIDPLNNSCSQKLWYPERSSRL